MTNDAECVIVEDVIAEGVIVEGVIVEGFSPSVPPRRKDQGLLALDLARFLEKSGAKTFCKKVFLGACGVFADSSKVPLT